MSNPRRALLFSFLDRYAGLAVSIASSMVLARLLTPTQTGTFSVAMGLLAFAAMFRDLGAGQYLLQERELTPDRLRAVWALQLGLGCLLALLVAAAAYPAAHFFNEPSLVAIFGVLALTYLINPLGSITYAWLVRAMRFESLALIRLLSALAGAMVSIGLAWRGVGAISLAWGALAGVLVQAAVSMAYRPAELPWRPGLREVGRVLGFGNRVTAVGILSAVREFLPELVVGKLQDLTAAGYLSRASGVMGMVNRLVMDPTYSVVQSLFAQRYRERQDLAAPLLRVLAYGSVLIWSTLAFVAVLAEPVIAVLYGPQWGDSVQPARWLAAGVAAAAPITVCSALLIATGGTRLQLRLATLHTLLVVGAALWAAPHGLTPLCKALALAHLLGLTVWLPQSCRHAQLALACLWQPLAQGLVVAAAVGLVPALLLSQMAYFPAALKVLAAGIPALLVFMISVRVLNHPLQQELLKVQTLIAQRWQRLLRKRVE